MEKRHIITRIDELMDELNDLMFDMTCGLDDPDYSDPIWEVYDKLDEAEDLCSDARVISEELMNAEG